MRAENVETVRKWWLANDARGLSAGEGAAACAAEKTCPKCKRTEGEVVFGVRKMWRGGELKLVRQSYCNKCR